MMKDNFTSMEDLVGVEIDKYTKTKLPTGFPQNLDLKKEN
jgi:hypothetical protein